MAIGMERQALLRLPCEPSFKPWSKPPPGPCPWPPGGCSKQSWTDTVVGRLLLLSGHRSPSSCWTCPARNFSVSALGQGTLL